MVLKSAPSKRAKVQLSQGVFMALATITVHHQHLQRTPKASQMLHQWNEKEHFLN